MKAFIQRVNHSSVKVDGETIGKIDKGFLVLLGIGSNDSKEEADYLVKKLVKLRIFEDEDGKMNRSLLDTEGSALIISQFTLYASTKKGNRPSFTDAMPPDQAKELYLYFIDSVRSFGIKVQTGRFGADMKVTLENDGPVSIMLLSKNEYADT